MPQKRTIDMTDVFTEEGRQNLVVGQLLRFRRSAVFKPGEPDIIDDYVVTSLDNDRVRVRRTTTYTMDEFEKRSARKQAAADVDQKNAELSKQGTEL